MTDPLKLDEIRTFWTRQANEHKLAPSVSWNDPPMIELEIRALLPHIDDGDRVLDAGCATGFTATQLASRRRIRLRGLDYIPEMVELARQRAQLPEVLRQLKGTVEFDVGDITALAEPAAAYDKVVVVRVVINLREWSRQLHALRQCARVLRPGGLLLLSESSRQGWEGLNRFRAEWGLPRIPMPAYNEFLDEQRVVDETPEELEFVSMTDFSSTYLIGTRVLKPLLAQALGGQLDVNDTNMEWNRWWAELPSVGDCGKQKLFVFRKR